MEEDLKRTTRKEDWKEDYVGRTFLTEKWQKTNGI